MLDPSIEVYIPLEHDTSPLYLFRGYLIPSSYLRGVYIYVQRGMDYMGSSN